jgi:hypothetical protein
LKREELMSDFRNYNKGLSEKPVQVNTHSAEATGRELLLNGYHATAWIAPYFGLFGVCTVVRERTDGIAGGTVSNIAGALL